MLKKTANEGVKRVFDFDKLYEEFCVKVRKNEDVIYGELSEVQEILMEEKKQKRLLDKLEVSLRKGSI